MLEAAVAVLAAGAGFAVGYWLRGRFKGRLRG